MNIILLTKKEWANAELGRVVLLDRRAHHIATVIKPVLGDRLRVGVLGGAMGEGVVQRVNDGRVELDVVLNQDPPPPLPLTLLLALPRPKVMRRVLQSCVSMGVKDIYLINSYRVEKSFWQTPFLTPESLHENTLLGLEQGRDTLLPKIQLRKRFKPFIEDELPAIATGKQCFTAHPVDNSQPIAAQPTQPTVLAIGPEGGFISYEVDKLAELGFKTIIAGPRILKVETAVPALISRLFF